MIMIRCWLKPRRRQCKLTYANRKEPVIGRYERDEVKPSIEVASKIAEALEISLDYLAGNSKVLLEKNIVKRITDIQQLPTDDKAHLFALMDAFLRDHKAKKAYAS
ncbi:MAG: helix-turn-helix transcriptional regulator [Chitinophagaceae bacterium]|nr:helix-turn-helix transcriptional regulator [Chitinophagaceae bacterium]